MLNTKTKLKKVAIIGLGLIGGSLALSIKKNTKAHVVGCSRRERTLATAKKRKAIDEGILDIREAVKDADLIIVSTPINLIIPTIKKIAPVLKPNAIVTDVGSSKERITAEAEKILAGKGFFVGGHPMAGSENTGIGAANKDLFIGATYVLTRTKKTNRVALNLLAAFLKKLQVNIKIMEPEKHDICVAAISHVPYIMAAALVNMLDHEKDLKNDMMDLAASGFRDTTRVASCDPLLGQDLCLTNDKAIIKMIDKLKRALQKIEDNIKKRNCDRIYSDFEQAKSLREKIYPDKNN